MCDCHSYHYCNSWLARLKGAYNWIRSVVVWGGQDVFHQNKLEKTQNYLKTFFQSQTLLLNTPFTYHVRGMGLS